MPIDAHAQGTQQLRATESQVLPWRLLHGVRQCAPARAAAQVIAEVTLEQDGDADFDRKLDALRREEALINEEAKEAAAFLKADIPVIQPGQVTYCSPIC